MLKEHLQQRVFDFIARYRIHTEHSHLADLDALRSLYRVRTLPRTAPIAAVTVRPNRAVDDVDALPEIWIRNGLSREDRRLAFAHEVSHDVLEHEASFPLKEIGPWYQNRNEREAWQGGALILINPRSIGDSPSVYWLKRECLVPAWLINEYPHLQQAFSLPQASRPHLFR